MHKSKNKEDLSLAYIYAICSYADIDYEIIRHDDDSTDGVLKKLLVLSDGSKFNVQLRIQLKCTSSTSQYKDNGDTIIYTLKVKNYNDLCTRSTMPIILGLLILPEDETQWLNWTPMELVLRGCMYWASFSGKKESTNDSTVSVKFDKNNVINSKTILDILEEIAKEE